MHNITRKLNQISDTVATDLLFTGFRTIMRDGGYQCDLIKGPDKFRVEIPNIDEPHINRVNQQKYWEVNLYCDGELMATGFADESDL
jgi:hypothetical protein